MQKRHWAAAEYNKRLCHAVVTPAVGEGFTSSYAQYTVRLENEAQRERVAARMKQAGVPVMVYYPRPMHGQTAFRGLADAGDYPVAEAACRQVLSLPMHPYLTEETIDTVCNALLAALQ